MDSLSRCVRNLKLFCVNRNRSWTRQTHSRDMINILLTSFSWSILKVTDPCFSLRFMACALGTWAINRWGKNLVRNLQYSPQTRLVRGIYYQLVVKTTEKQQFLKRKQHFWFYKTCFAIPMSSSVANVWWLYIWIFTVYMILSNGF